MAAVELRRSLQASVRFLRRCLTLPPRDVVGGLEEVLQGGAPGLGMALIGLVLGWWVYVPIHELLHAAGCWLAGGEVQRLELAPLYGGAWLARFLPFVVAGGPYAGRLAAFDSGGSDLVYAVAVVAPYLLTVFPGVWLLRRGAGGRGLVFGAALPLALAPFVSLTGDAYELGAIVVTATGPLAGPEVSLLLRGDDLLALAAGAWSAGRALVRLGLVVATLVGVAWAFGTYALGHLVAVRIERRRGSA